jgi:uncharacterized protein YodC (DUF2158 family)
MADQFKPGDTVRLKSGGPLMTVEEYGDYSGKRKCRCKWFGEKNKLEHGTFADAELVSDDGSPSVG